MTSYNLCFRFLTCCPLPLLLIYRFLCSCIVPHKNILDNFQLVVWRSSHFVEVPNVATLTIPEFRTQLRGKKTQEHKNTIINIIVSLCDACWLRLTANKHDSCHRRIPLKKKPSQMMGGGAGVRQTTTVTWQQVSSASAGVPPGPRARRLKRDNLVENNSTTCDELKLKSARYCPQHPVYLSTRHIISPSSHTPADLRRVRRKGGESCVFYGCCEAVFSGTAAAVV